MRYTKIAPVLLAIIIDSLGFGLVYPVMVAVFATTNSPLLPPNAGQELRDFYLGLGFMLYPLCMFFGTSFMADLSDHLGRKKALLICMAGICLSFLSMGLAIQLSSLLVFMLGRAISGLMAGSQPIAQAAIADLSTPETKARNMSIIAFSYSVGSVAGPLLGGITSDNAVVSWFNFSTPFYASALLAAIAAVWLFLGFHETFQPPALAQPISLIRPIQIFLEAFQQPLIRVLAIVFLLAQMGFSIYFQFITLLMHDDYAYGNWQLGLVQGMVGLGFAMGLLVGIPMGLRRFSVLELAILTWTLTGIGQVLVFFIPSAVVQWPLAVLIAVLDIMAFTTTLTLFSNSVSQDRQGWAMGIANAAMALAWALTGLSSNALPLFGTRGLIFIGGICILAAAWTLQKKQARYTATSGSEPKPAHM